MPDQPRNIPPSYCEYANGPCDQDFSHVGSTGHFFIYPSQPELISKSIELALAEINKANAPIKYMSWRDLNIVGKIVFCEICKALRSATCVYADVTSLNFNVLFEVGYCIGLGIPLSAHSGHHVHQRYEGIR
jgi:hypothetical protein